MIYNFLWILNLVIVKCQLNYNEVKVTNRMDDILYIELDFQNRNFAKNYFSGGMGFLFLEIIYIN